MTCVGLWPNNANVEDPTVTVKSKTAPKPMFLNFILCLTLKLHIILCSLYPYHFLCICVYVLIKEYFIIPRKLIYKLHYGMLLTVISNMYVCDIILSSSSLSMYLRCSNLRGCLYQKLFLLQILRNPLNTNYSFPCVKQ